MLSYLIIGVSFVAQLLLDQMDGSIQTFLGATVKGIFIDALLEDLAIPLLNAVSGIFGHGDELRDLRLQLESANARHQADVERLEAHWQMLIDDRRVDHQTATRDLLNRHQAEIAGLQIEHQSSLETLRDGHRLKVLELDADHEREIIEINTGHVEEFNILRKGNDARILRIAALQEDAFNRSDEGMKELRSINEQLEAANQAQQILKGALEVTNKRLAAENKTLRDRLDKQENLHSPRSWPQSPIEGY